MTEPVLVRIIDDDLDVRRALALLLECAGHCVAVYESADMFLATDDLTRPGCVLCDIRMPGMSGLELQMEMIRRDIRLPLIFITGHGDIEMAVDALQAGAYDFLTKPVKQDRLFATLNRALTVFDLQEAQTYKDRLAKLSEREHDVLRLILQGLGTRQIAERLNIGERTVQGHRWRIYQKVGLNSTALLQQHIKLH